MILITGTFIPLKDELKHLFTYIKESEDRFIVGDSKGTEYAAYTFCQILDKDVTLIRADWTKQSAMSDRNASLLSLLSQEEVKKIVIVGEPQGSNTQKFVMDAVLTGAEIVRL